FPGSLPAARHAVHTGNPVRAAIAALPEPARRLSEHAGALHLLVIGGSLGAEALNRVVPQAVARLPQEARPQIHHQTGQADADAVRARYQELGSDVRVEAFVEDMAAAYAWADLVVCRAGALTVAELCAAGVASILVPFPYATDDHQTGNAGYLADAGAAVLLPQPELTAERLAERLAAYSADRPVLLEMASRARELARPDAARQVAGFCLQAAGQAPLPGTAGGAA
ncbi:MAG: UDP-N-acetylglucosamine--N-acetylmuramyl-(pentapeptide) pyrophosphoryl-undecaprenol N-acetylglucosamine transferase, partial [Gammaproteobacteria bacterium]|nr:UDP-N-acetylglucosamine--N-acetylmuramyl-(pentapeptide) pyrophosphoryl-undecaprenol N-acetylglucosamine transferase [Gammaproteobacteria bacterium]